MIANPESNQQSTTDEKDTLQSRLVPVSIVLYQAIAIIALIVVAFFAFGWLRTPLGSPQFSKPELISLLIIPWIVGAVYLGCGIWVFVLQQQDISSRVFAVLSASTAMALAVFFDIQSTHRLDIVWFLGVIMAAGSLFHLALVFPTRISKSEIWNYLPFLGYGVSMVLLLISLLLVFESNRGGAIVAIQRISLGWLGIAILSFLTIATLRQMKANSLLVRQRGRIVYLGIILSLLPFVIWVFGRMIQPGIWLNPIVFVTLAVFPLSVAYSILRYRLPGTDYILSRIFMYGLLTVVAVSGYALIVSGLGLVFGEMLGLNNPISVGLVFFLLAISLHPLRGYLQKLVDSAFFRGQLAYQERVRIFGQDLTPILDLKEIGILLRKYVDETLAPSQLHIFLPDPAQEYFVALPSETGDATTDLRFAQISALPTMLSRNPTNVVIGNDGVLPPVLEGEKARLALLGAQVFGFYGN
jgi:two-component system, NtrC family, sensor kinase